ncbi:hypothetical protein PoB_004078300 [Plakobranchus ocellatus]|uniref:Uncharacterized protein n=1 Tax=Plakobranchus ocellatus TaxID=259542 RepID=A0AAV4B672_9GAST|nr:hypothetical protein PoB_004078300 [Plakobranchus ocellatus]
MFRKLWALAAEGGNFTINPTRHMLGVKTIDFLSHRFGGDGSASSMKCKESSDCIKAQDLAGGSLDITILTSLSDLVLKGQPNLVAWDDAQARAHSFLNITVTFCQVLLLPNV